MSSIDPVQQQSTTAGRGDFLDLSRVCGWAWDSARPNERVRVDIACDDEVIGSVLADEFREDLATRGMGDGRHAFAFALPDRVRDGQPHFISLRFGGTQRQLENSPRGIGDFSRRPVRRSLYEKPRDVELESCDFYHTMDLPGFGTVEGEWDLRGREAEYLGKVDFADKRVLEVGKASGFLTFFMESQGANVVAYDLSEFDAWDIVPYSRAPYDTWITQTRTNIWRLNNGFWFARKAFGRQAQLVLGSVYDLPAEIGEVDIAVLAAVLLHVRDPFRALQNALRQCRETAILVEVLPQENADSAAALFLPNAETCEPQTTWWSLPPPLLQRFLDVLGFETVEQTRHQQRHRGENMWLYTLVARRRNDEHASGPR